MSPACSASAARTARARASGRSRGPAMSRAACWMVTGNMRPALSTTSARISAARRAPSAVADIASRRSSGRSWACRSRQRASARSDSSERSWISSRITAATPSRPGSDCRRRTSRPSVTTSIRVSAETAESSRVRKPTVRPSGSPSSEAMRAAAARVASRRGSSTRILPPAAPGRVEQHQRHERGLAGAGRGDQHGVAPGGEVFGQRGQRVGDGEVGQRCHGVLLAA